MKRTILLVVGFIGLMFVKSNGQTSKLPAAIGPYFSEKFGISAITTPQGRKNGVAFSGNPGFGASAYIPFGKETNLGMTFDLGYDTYSYIMKDGNDILPDLQFKYSYLCFNPSLFFDGFTFGINFAFPMSANYEGKEIKTSMLNTVVEAKIGWTQPLYRDATGRLNFVATAGYTLGGVYNDFVQNDPLKNMYPAVPPQRITSSFNPRVASITVGFNFLFNLSPQAENEGGENTPM